jgi:two-component system, NarL family, nitrate/nitrite response regulator NarL
MQLASPISAPKLALSSSESVPQDGVRVLLMEHDPISMHVIGQTLRSSRHIHSTIESENCGDISDQNLGASDVVLISCSHKVQCLAADRLAQVLKSGRRVMSLRAEWDRQLIEKAITSGVSGFLVKGPRLSGLPAAVLAVSKGQAVFAPEIIENCSRLRSISRSHSSIRPDARHSLRRPLTAREREVLQLLGQGLSTREAAAALHVSTATIKSHVSHSLTKLGARNRLEAVLLMDQA